MSYEPKPSLPRPIYSPVDHYDVDVTTGTVSYHVVRTNGDRIRAMGDEDLAEMFCLMSGGIHPFSISDSSDGEQWIKWLKEEVKDG